MMCGSQNEGRLNGNVKVKVTLVQGEYRYSSTLSWPR